MLHKLCYLNINFRSKFLLIYIAEFTLTEFFSEKFTLNLIYVSENFLFTFIYLAEFMLIVIDLLNTVYVYS